MATYVNYFICLSDQALEGGTIIIPFSRSGNNLRTLNKCKDTKSISHGHIARDCGPRNQSKCLIPLLVPLTTRPSHILQMRQLSPREDNTSKNTQLVSGHVRT